jgi:F420-dependent oxidoreductase-like protein
MIDVVDDRRGRLYNGPMFRIALQIPNFTYPGVAPDELFETVASVASAGEQGGFDAVMVMDHFYQLPLLGPPSNEMFEAYTLLGAIAARTSTAMLGTLVTGVTYRNPAVLAKIVTTLDVVSKGRAFLGIGAAWFDPEHTALGVDFPSTKARLEMLEEAIAICRGMFRGEQPTITGTHYRTHDVINSPAPIRAGGPPIMVGGAGEKVTFRIAAQHADMLNTTAGFDELPQKMKALNGHLDRLGRERSAIHVSSLGSLVLGESEADAARKRNDFLAARGISWDDLGEAMQQMVGARLVVGNEEQVIERVGQLRELGMDGVVFNLPADGWKPDAVRHAATVLTKAMA